MQAARLEDAGLRLITEQMVTYYVIFLTESGAITELIFYRITHLSAGRSFHMLPDQIRDLLLTLSAQPDQIDTQRTVGLTLST